MRQVKYLKRCGNRDWRQVKCLNVWLHDSYVDFGLVEILRRQKVKFVLIVPDLPLLISLLADTTGPTTVYNCWSHYCSPPLVYYCLQLPLTTVGHTTATAVCNCWSHYWSPLLVSLLVTLPRTIAVHLFTTTGETTVDHH